MEMGMLSTIIEERYLDTIDEAKKANKPEAFREKLMQALIAATAMETVSEPDERAEWSQRGQNLLPLIQALDLCLTEGTL